MLFIILILLLLVILVIGVILKLVILVLSPRRATVELVGWVVACPKFGIRVPWANHRYPCR